MPLIPVILGNAAVQDWEIHHVDIKSAYLNALLKEKVYMKLLPGVLNPGRKARFADSSKVYMDYIRQGEAGIKRWQGSLSISLDSKSLQSTTQYSIEERKMNIPL